MSAKKTPYTNNNLIIAQNRLIDDITNQILISTSRKNGGDDTMNKKIHKYFEMLGVSFGASAEDIKRAYIKKTKIWNPSKFKDDPSKQNMARNKIAEYNEAFKKALFFSGSVDTEAIGTQGQQTKPGLTRAKTQKNTPHSGTQKGQSLLEQRIAGKIRKLQHDDFIQASAKLIHKMISED
jgi:hypothetical protein